MQRKSSRWANYFLQNVFLVVCWWLGGVVGAFVRRLLFFLPDILYPRYFPTYLAYEEAA